MQFNDYQEAAELTAIYSDKFNILYPLTLVAAEAGEALGKYGKAMRDDGGRLSVERRMEILNELGDATWAIAVAAADLGATFDDVAQMNLDKLKSRQQRGVLRGSGDDR